MILGLLAIIIAIFIGLRLYGLGGVGAAVALCLGASAVFALSGLLAMGALALAEYVSINPADAAEQGLALGAGLGAVLALWLCTKYLGKLARRIGAAAAITGPETVSPAD